MLEFSRRSIQNSDKGERVENLEKFVDVLYGWFRAQEVVGAGAGRCAVLFAELGGDFHHFGAMNAQVKLIGLSRG